LRPGCIPPAGVLFNLTIDNASPFTLLKKVAVPEILGTATLPKA
jgi:hypothetical protein